MHNEMINKMIEAAAFKIQEKTPYPYQKAAEIAYEAIKAAFKELPNLMSEVKVSTKPEITYKQVTDAYFNTYEIYQTLKEWSEK